VQERVHGALRLAVKRRLVADVPVGVLLSGEARLIASLRRMRQARLGTGGPAAMWHEHLANRVASSNTARRQRNTTRPPAGALPSLCAIALPQCL
jgi:Asparagine synthase